MSETGAYGRHLGRALQVRTAASFVTRDTLNKAEIAVTLIKVDEADNALTSPVASEDAFLLMLQLRDWPNRVLWADDRPVHAEPLKTGMLSIFDLKRKWVGHRVCPIHQLNFYLPRKTLNNIADMEGVARIERFDNDPAKGAADATVFSLGKALLPAFAHQNEVNRLFVDSITTATAIHVLRVYGAKQTLQQKRGIVDPVSRAKELLASDLKADVTLLDLATACGLPVSRLARAFFKSVGTSPHRWLMQRRMEEAMRLLRTTDRASGEIATECGFADTRHLDRVFQSRTGLSVRAWRTVARH